MTRFFTLLLLLSSYLPLSAQIGVQGSYLSMTAPDWAALYEPGDFPGQGFKVGLDYWFRLKNVRVEFLPELAYSRFSGEAMDAGFFHFQWNTNIYPFDFYGDCDCPTFSKQNPLLKKGFFLQAAPGIAYGLFEAENGDKASDLLYSLAAGAGLDIGISDRLTLSPYGKFWYFLDADLDPIPGYSEQPVAPEDQERALNAPLQFWEAGLRIGLRFDQ